MNCENYQELTSAELDDELTEGSAIALWNHLAQCAVCRRWRGDQLSIRRDFASWQEEVLPRPPVSVAVERHPPKANVYRIPRLVAWAAGVVIFAQGVYLASQLVATPKTNTIPRGADIRTVETIVLDAKDCTTYKIEERWPSGPPQPNSQRNGG